MSFTPHTPEEIREMLATIGIGSIGDLFHSIPKELRARSFDLSPGMSEFEMLARLNEMAAQNGRVVPFVGGGYYDHVIPAAVDHLAGRAEFYTAYTPYQPECSQGSLQALFEYQTVICRLTGLEASNASLYDGGTALAEAAMMALRITGRDRVILDGAVNPFHRAIVRTYLANLPVEIVELSPVNGMLNRQSLAVKLDDRCAAVIVQNPTFFGCVADYSDLAAQVHKSGALLISSVYAVSSGDTQIPGRHGRRHRRGRRPEPREPPLLRRTGLRLYRRKEAVHPEHARPDRGPDCRPRRTPRLRPDAAGPRAAHQAPQGNLQHLQQPEPLRPARPDLPGEPRKTGACGAGAAQPRQGRIRQTCAGRGPGWSIPFDAPTFNEFTLRLPKRADDVVASMLKRGVAVGVPLGSYYPGEENSVVVTVTEKRTKGEIALLARELEGALWN